MIPPHLDPVRFSREQAEAEFAEQATSEEVLHQKINCVGNMVLEQRDLLLALKDLVERLVRIVGA